MEKNKTATPAKKKAATKAKKKPDLVIEKIHARFKLSGVELGELGLAASREQDIISGLEEQISSIKKDYSSKIEAAESRRNEAFRKLKDGFEMRETEVVIEFDAPAKTKRIYRYDQKKKGGKGELITTEPMTPADFERDLFAKKPADKPADAFDTDTVNNAIECVRKEGKASVAMLQRRFNIGYGKASKLMDELEKQKIVGPSKGSEPRDVLAPPLNPALSEDDAKKAKEKIEGATAANSSATPESVRMAGDNANAD